MATDAPAYTLTMIDIAYETVIVMTYTHNQAGPIQFSSCPEFVPSRLQLWNGQAWEMGWQPIALPFPCTSPPSSFIVVPPGDRYQFSWTLFAEFYASRFLGARFSRADPMGVYRPVWDVTRVPGSADAAIPVPLEAKISNNFETKLPP